MKEPIQAFPYKPPNDEIKKKYSYIFSNDFKMPIHHIKIIFDKVIALLLLILALPTLALLKLAFLLEGILIPENSGPMFFSYNAVSKGQIFPKYKIRLIKTKFIDPEGAKKGDWIAYCAEWNNNSRK